jgi:hypothetical protein
MLQFGPWLWVRLRSSAVVLGFYTASVSSERQKDLFACALRHHRGVFPLLCTSDRHSDVETRSIPYS